MNLSLRDSAISRFRESGFMHKAAQKISTVVGKGGILHVADGKRIYPGQRGESGKTALVERDRAEKNFFTIPR